MRCAGTKCSLYKISFKNLLNLEDEDIATEQLSIVDLRREVADAPQKSGDDDDDADAPFMSMETVGEN